MGVVRDAAQMLLAALSQAGYGEATADPGATLANVPALVLGPPRLVWESGCVDPTDAVFMVHAVVAASELASEQLWDMVTDVSRAVDERTEDRAAVTGADPGGYLSGTQTLPSYNIQIEVSL